jgi:hypothetical protein
LKKNNSMQRVLHRPVEPAGVTGNWDCGEREAKPISGKTYRAYLADELPYADHPPGIASHRLVTLVNRKLLRLDMQSDGLPHFLRAP